MRLLFAHDHRFQRGPKEELYTLGSFPASFWDRYLEHFENVHVMARNGGETGDETRLSRADRADVAFEFLPNLSRLPQLFLPSSAAYRQMASAMESADAVVVRLPSEIGLLALRAARRLRKPYAVEVVGCAWDACLNHGTVRGRIYAPLSFARMRHAVARAPLVLYVTSSWLQRRYPSDGQQWSASNVMLPPFGPEARKSRKQRLSALKRHERPVLGTVASLRVRFKGVQTALAAVSQLRASGIDLSYRVLGPGPTEPWKQLAARLGISNLVHFDGTRSAGDGVCEWLDGIDIHLQPSFQEGLPRATIEAMSRGVACLGSTCGGIPELLPPDRTHRPGDVAGLAALIRRFASNPEELIAASAADSRTAQRFDPELLRKSRSALYRRLRAEAERSALETGLHPSFGQASL